MKYRKGDKVKITGNSNDHDFQDGEIVTIEEYDNEEKVYMARNNGDYWWLLSEDFELVEPKETLCEEVKKPRDINMLKRLIALEREMKEVKVERVFREEFKKGDVVYAWDNRKDYEWITAGYYEEGDNEDGFVISNQEGLLEVFDNCSRTNPLIK